MVCPTLRASGYILLYYNISVVKSSDCRVLANTYFMNYRSIILFFLISFLNSSAYADKPIILLASIPPLGLLANSIVGDRAQVEVLLDAQASPHHYALTISDRQKLVSSDMVLWVGSDLEGFLAKPIKQRLAKQQRTISALHLAGIVWPDIDNKDAGKAHDHDHGDHDPHIWLNPINNVLIIDALVEQLSQLDPDNTDYYRRNAENQKAQLYELDRTIMTMMAPLQAVPFIVGHPAYTHFVYRYHLQQLHYIAMTPERNSGAKHLIALRQLKQARCVFTDYGVPNPKAEQLALDLGVPSATLDPLGIRPRVSANQQRNFASENSTGIIFLIAQLANDFQKCLSLTTH